MNALPPEPTRFSLAGVLPQAPDRREDERDHVLLRIGSLLLDGRRETCLIRNISPGGALVRTCSRIPTGKSVALELRQGESVSGLVRWSKDSMIGIMFLQAVDILRLLSESSDLPHPRQPRVEIFGTAHLKQCGVTAVAAAIDISQGGIKVRTRTPLLASATVIDLEGLPALPATQRWSHGETYGLQFATPLTLQALVRWLRYQQKPPGGE